MNKIFFDKTMINVTKHRGIKPVTGEKRRNYLVSEQNYQVTIFFSENVLALEMKKNTHKDNHEWTSLVWCINIKIKQDSNIWVWYDYAKPN